MTSRSAARAPRALRPGSVGEVARLFLRLGVLGFGGPAAHIAMMRDEVVRRRGWMDDASFLELVGATNLIPGPNSTELAIHLGHRRAGPRGLVVAGLCFIAPAALIVGTLAWLYREHGTDPRVVDLRYGVLPVIVAVVGHAVVGLGRTAVRSVLHAAIAVGALIAYLAGVHELLVLAAAGALATLWHRRRGLGRRVSSLLWPVWLTAVPDTSRPPVAPTLWRLALVFGEIGGVLYGSGYVLLAFLQRHLVDDLGWLSGRQLLDAIAVGQVTPGPVFTTATFVGWQVHGWSGALVATVAIFAPSFVFVALLGRIVDWMRHHPTARAFLAGVTTASLGLMAGVLIELAGDALTDAVTVVVALVALALLVRTKVNSAWLVGAGVLIGALHALA
ncbi:MAG: chromate efflux transporter [Acidimicrobiales bacterium]